MNSVLRELNKAKIGFQGDWWENNTQEIDPKERKIVAGKWGCGIFNGDPLIKFTVQWMAASLY